MAKLYYKKIKAGDKGTFFGPNVVSGSLQRRA